MEYTKIFTDSQVLVRGLEVLLNEQGITPIIKDPINSGQLAGFGAQINSVEMYVPDNDLEKAQPIVDAYKSKIALDKK